MKGKGVSMRSLRGLFVLSVLVCLVAVLGVVPAGAEQFEVGYAQRDITPKNPMPMWGYGARHEALSEGVRDPLFARALVIDVGETKLAIVGMDLGRAPTRWMMPVIREAVKADSGIDYRHPDLAANLHRHSWIVAS